MLAGPIPGSVEPTPLPSLDDDRFSPTFALLTPADHRTRQVGAPCRWSSPARQGDTAARAVQAGYQMRRGLVRPLFQEEPEPGQAVRIALQAIHPFTVDPVVPPPLLDNIDKVCSAPREVVARRRALLELWGARAGELAPVSLAAIRGLSDPYLRRLLLGTKDAEPGPQLGQFAHVALWQQLVKAANALDQGYVQEFLNGLPIVGDVARSLHARPCLGRGGHGA